MSDTEGYKLAILVEAGSIEPDLIPSNGAKKSFDECDSMSAEVGETVSGKARPFPLTSKSRLKLKAPSPNWKSGKPGPLRGRSIDDPRATALAPLLRSSIVTPVLEMSSTAGMAEDEAIGVAPPGVSCIGDEDV